MSLYTSSIKDLKYVGAKSAVLFNKLGINTIGSLVLYRPISYENWAEISSIYSATANEGNTVIQITIIKESTYIPTRTGKKIYRIIATSDEEIVNIIFFDNKNIAKSLKTNDTCLVMGKVLAKKTAFEIISPKIRNISKNNSQNFKLVPIYAQTQGLPSWRIMRAIQEAIKLIDVKETLPEFLTKKFHLISLDLAIKKMHFPETFEDVNAAIKRLTFEELLTWCLAMYVIKNKIPICPSVINFFSKNSQTNTQKNSQISTPEQLSFYRDKKNYIPKKTSCQEEFKTYPIKNYSDEFLETVPFRLTNAQKTAIKECTHDMMSRTSAMRRLLQGDVGSGKTIIAMALAYNIIKNGMQCAIMVPTEILALQHYKNFSENFKNVKHLEISEFIYIITGCTPKKQKDAINRRLLLGMPTIVIGTHCLISQKLEFTSLVFVVTDEQHRFGIEQRSALISKGSNPHMLVMSATPIPRSLALVFYGDLDFSILNELPPGRKKVKTFVINSEQRSKALEFLHTKLKEGAQAYIICPVITDEIIEENNINLVNNDKKKLNLVSVESYKKKFLSDEFIKKFKTEIIHSKLKKLDKTEIMSNFHQGNIKLLISTTVIEVGIDVANASVMIIENAERFGLATLHQLRGRIGRGNQESYCILISESKWGDAVKRLSVMKKSNDGFYLASKDLEQRGPGEFFGKKQHGNFNINLIEALKNDEIIKDCNQASKEIIKITPDLSLLEMKFIRKKIANLLESI
ncbi:MAG: ATP-dependent DNA helicase RecG [Candidatus Improbicoccus devescovinae]|nr:MAG: ATP-dependent DNA helicase RecG [Candidatus Improbicoccus devescovinae]